MLTRILLNLLYTLLCSAAISAVIMAIVYYNSPSLREDFEVSDLFFWLFILYDKLVAYSLIALFAAIPAIWNNKWLSALVYFVGCVLFVFTTALGVNTTPLGGIVAVWAPFVVFVLVHAFFYYRLTSRRRAAQLNVT